MPILLSVRTCTRHVRYVMFREYCLMTLPRWITCSIVMSTLDYCNSLVYGAPKTTVDKLQYTGLCGDAVWEMLNCQTATPAVTLASCHRVHQLQAGSSHLQITLAPKYLCSLLQPHHNIRSLRSSTAPRFFVPPTRTEIGKRTFRVSAPTVWNALPSAVCLSDSAAGFKHRLKTSLFNCVFNCDINSDSVSSS